MTDKRVRILEDKNEFDPRREKSTLKKERKHTINATTKAL
jgi:hypothetical protein